MIGKGTGTGKVIYEGTAKPDDPVFKEGWSIHIGSFTGQLSDSPSSTSDEADEPDVMRDALSGKVIRCPYCKSAKECQHWLAFTNWDFPYEPSGYCSGKFDQFHELTENAFLSRLQSGISSDCRWGDPELNKLWTEAFEDFQYSKSVWMDRVVRVAEFPRSLLRFGNPKPHSIQSNFPFADKPTRTIGKHLKRSPDLLNNAARKTLHFLWEEDLRVRTNQFLHRANWDGTFDSICRVCYVTVGRATCESGLDKAQEDHRCDPWMPQRMLQPHDQPKSSDSDEAVRPPPENCVWAVWR